MARFADKLNKIFDRAIQEKVISLKAMSDAKMAASENIKSLPTIKQLIDDGLDPNHAIYTNTLNLISLFADEVTALPPLHAIHDFISKWHDIYMPGMPPMTPVTNSYFTSWTLLDAAFGVDKETIGACFLSLSKRLFLNPLQAEAARNLEQSRMGIYEVLQTNGQYFELRELITEKKFTAYICSGYTGSAGDLIFLRLLPPLENSVNYYVALTTPYLFLHQIRENWELYFKRHDIIANTVGVQTRLHRHLKYGKNRTYWSEHIFYGYSNHRPGVILLYGFPDQPETMPQHPRYKNRPH